MHPFEFTANEGLNQVCVCGVCFETGKGKNPQDSRQNIAALQIKPVASIAGDTLMSYLLRREKERMVAGSGWKGEKTLVHMECLVCEQQAEGSWLHACVVCVCVVCVCVGTTEARSLLQAAQAGQGTAGRADGQPKLVVTLTFAC